MSDQVFVSYSHQDSDFITYLEDHLPGDFTLWTDNQITPGLNWQVTIDEAIHNSFAVLVLLSPAAAASSYVTYEWSYALGINRPVITLLIADTPDIHPRLQTYQYLDFTNLLRAQPQWSVLAQTLNNAQREYKESEGAIKTLDMLHDARVALLHDAQEKRSRNDLNNALDTLMQAVRYAPDHLLDDIHYEAAAVYRQLHAVYRAKDESATAKQQLELAQEHLDKAIALNPKHAQALVMLGEVYRALADAEDDETQYQWLLKNSENKFEAALLLQPNILDESGESVYGSLGGILKRRHEIDEAIEAYRKACRVRQTSYPNNNLGLLYMQQGDITRMKRRFRLVQLLAQKRVEGLQEIDDWAYNDLLVSQLVLDQLDDAQHTLDMIGYVSREQTIRTLHRTLATLKDSPAATPESLAFIEQAQAQLDEYLQEIVEL